MKDNIFIGPDAHARFTLQMLRSYEGAGDIGRGRHDIQDGVFISCDPDVGISGRFESHSSNMLSISLQASRNPRWQALHIELGSLSLGEAAVIGVVARSQSTLSTTTRICIRSGNGGNFVDTFFPKTMASFSQASTHLDVLDLSAASNLPKQAEWRDLVLFFRAGNISLDLLDLRLFVV